MLSVERAGDQVELSVADDGIGMTKSDTAKNQERRGSDYVAIFVRQLGGTIVPTPVTETGTVIRIRLPFLLLPPETAPLAA